MGHTLAERLHHDEERVRSFLEGIWRQYGILFIMLLMLMGLGLWIVFFLY